MQPCSSEMQAINSLLNPSQIQQIHNPHHLDMSSHDDFLDQMLSSIPSCSWPDPTALKSSSWDPRPDETDSENVGFHSTHFPDESAALVLASKLRQHQISSGVGGGGGSHSPPPNLMMEQQMMMTMMMSDHLSNEIVDGSSSFKSPINHQGGDGSVQALYNGFIGGQSSNQPQHFHHQQTQNLGAHSTVMNQAQPQVQVQVQASGSTGTAQPAQPRQRVRARRGQATDPHSIAERLRRERIAERMKALQELVPNANKTDKASMLDEIIDYVKFLQLQVKVLSMSRLGGAAGVAPLVADISSEGGGGGGDCIQATSNNNKNGSSNDNLTVTEHQVVKLMEEDMGSAMQYLQGKGLCLMPISLATAISTATCHTKNPLMNNHNPLLNGGEGPSSPSVSALTVQSATIGNAGPDGSVKDNASVSKP